VQRRWGGRAAVSGGGDAADEGSTMCAAARGPSCEGHRLMRRAPLTSDEPSGGASA
jgi:hypothetical protein